MNNSKTLGSRYSFYRKNLGVKLENIRGVLIPDDNSNDKPSTQANFDEKVLEGFKSYSTLLYRGISIEKAAKTGDLPVFVLLWTMAHSKKINLFVADELGNTILHYAALSDDDSIIQFTSKRIKGALLNEIPIFQVANNNGHTPLMTAISNGNIPVVKVFIELGCDVFEVNHNGLNIFIKACKYGHLWLLNYLYTYISTRYGQNVAMTMLRKKDIEHHGVMEWGANSCNVQLLEYLIRNGIDPSDKDLFGRDSLYWAVKSGDPATVNFLVKFGLDPRMVDKNGVTPLTIALERNDYAIIRALIGDWKLRVFYNLGEVFGFNSKSHIYKNVNENSKRSNDEESNQNIEEESNQNIELWKRCYSSDSTSNAIYNHKYIRINYLIFFTLLFCVVWFISISFTFYNFIIVCIVFAAIYKYGVYRLNVKNQVNNVNNNSNDNVSNNVTRSNKSFFELYEDAIAAPEKFVAIWFGGFFATVFFLVACYTTRNSYPQKEQDLSINDYRMLNSVQDFLLLAGLGSAYYYPGFFRYCVVHVILCFIAYVLMVFVYNDPGIIDTRYDDFNIVLRDSLKNLGPPSPDLFCRTTMCKKPLRSKYCVVTEALVARMDHYCIYLNNCIGYKNHRPFLLFLLIHLQTTLALTVLIFQSIWRDFDNNHNSSCYISYTLLTRHYWFCVALGLCYGITTLSVCGLLLEQIYCILTNRTINEVITTLRKGDEEISRQKNIFDEGCFGNFLDFFRLFRYKNYYQYFEIEREIKKERDYINDGASTNASEFPSTDSGRYSRLSISVDGSQSQGHTNDSIIVS